jgi:hypothetical protein
MVVVAVEKKKKVVVGSLAALACEACLYFFACCLSIRLLSLSAKLTTYQDKDGKRYV